MALLFQFTWAFLWLAGNVAESRMSFLALGDWGKGSTRQKNVAHSMGDWAACNNPEFVITMGDNFYPDGITSPADSQFNTKWRDMYSHLSMRNITWYVTIGNHDYHYNREFNQVKFSQREQRWRMPYLWYSFKRTDGSVRTHFIIIDTEAIHEKKNNYKRQLSWFEMELRNSKSDYIFVFGHRHMYSVGNYGPYSDTMTKVVRPLLEKYKVDIYFSGHDHNQQHFQKAQNPDVDYVLHGGGGALLYYFNSTYYTSLKNMGIDVEYARPSGGFLGVFVDSRQVFVEYIVDHVALYTTHSPGKSGIIDSYKMQTWLSYVN